MSLIMTAEQGGAVHTHMSSDDSQDGRGECKLVVVVAYYSQGRLLQSFKPQKVRVKIWGGSS